MCPLEAIVETRRQLGILKRLCDGCGDCVPYCPVRAIVPKEAIRERQALNVAVELRHVLENVD
jgi:Fe-S-cluster-containing hydrogenase component 2